MKIAVAQMNPVVGDIKGNASKALALLRQAEASGAELVLFPELALTGYPPLDLLERPEFVRENLRALAALAARTRGTACLIGYADFNPSPRGRRLLNGAALLHKGRIAGRRFKSLLPTYDIFDESRWFEPAAANEPLTFKGIRLGVTICEDIWAGTALLPWRELYGGSPLAGLMKKGADLYLNLSASPYYCGKPAERLSILARVARRLGRPLVYANQYGANDDLIFDGGSLALDGRGRILAAARPFAPDLLLFDTETSAGVPAPPFAPGEAAELRAALKLGIADYFSKMGFSRAVLGLSGGIDSALVACLAADALGPDNVTALLMPSRFTEKRSVDDALRLARALGIRHETIPIDPLYRTFAAALGRRNPYARIDLTLQNLQSRARGTLLMARANEHGALALATGNKSEIAMGYCTLYGDTAGALAPLADLVKGRVYALSALYPEIPASTMRRPPTAELKPGQRDQDDLPPYDKLDRLVQLLVEDGVPPERAAARAGLSAKEALLIAARITASEYKRRQLPIGLKVTRRAFGPGRKMPVAKRLPAGPGPGC
ncbi:MAG: NAD+ synthase (glutamine-hydrolysing) [Elusimicrobia bacterium]|nr:MAG: NAD+ synthase (glutamine-hydrolysing) [Elusimicrobiota bacterium]KAF0153771.1 MAG: NAD+ synthase (glutamine-hydrolysing) [Elusimicrobiota bacterium]